MAARDIAWNKSKQYSRRHSSDRVASHQHQALIWRYNKSLDSGSTTCTTMIICPTPREITTVSIAGSRIACKVNDSTMRLIQCKTAETYTLSRSLQRTRQAVARNLRKATRTTGVDLAEHDLLELVVERQDTSTSDTTEDVGTSTLEERLGTLLGDDLRSGIEHGLVVNGATRSHHHATTVGRVSKGNRRPLMKTTDRIVSRGYEARPAPIVTPQPSMKDAKKEPWSAPTRTTGSAKMVNDRRQ